MRLGTATTGKMFRQAPPLLIALTVLLLPAAAAAQTGVISGTVTNAFNGVPIANVPVVAFDARGGLTQQGVSNASGAYVIENLTPGRYFVYTSNLGTWVNEVLPDTPCPSVCSHQQAVSLGEPLTVGAFHTVTGVNFDLWVGGRIRGTITNAASGLPLAGVDVHAYLRVGSQRVLAGSATSNLSGVYLISGLAAGDYAAATSEAGTLGLVNEVFEDIQCPGACTSAFALETATPIPVTLLSTTNGRDFALEAGGSISGSITAAASGVPVVYAVVQVYTAVGAVTRFAGSAMTNASGVYTLPGLPDGTYFAHTTSVGNYVNEIFDDLHCPLGCSESTAVQSGTGIAVRAGVVTVGTDFALERGGSIAGTVTEAATAVAIPGARVTVVGRIGSTYHTTWAYTDAAGVYTVSGLPTGVYRAFAFTTTFVNEIYGNVPCVGACPLPTIWAAGTPIAVTAGATTGDRDFVLDPGSSITGTLRNELTSLPIEPAAVSVLANIGGTPTVVRTATTNGSGNYAAEGLQPGSYWLVADAPTYRSEVYDDIPCLGRECSSAEVMAGTPVMVPANSVLLGRNFALRPRGAISGHVVDGATGARLANVTVAVYDRTSGVIVGGASSNAAGYYWVGTLPNGSYVAYTSNTIQYVNEIFNGIRCAASCSPATAIATGSQISVTAGAETGGIDFGLELRNSAPAAPGNLQASGSGFTVTFSWSAPSTQFATAATSFVLEAGLSPGTTLVSLPANATSITIPNVPTGTFYVRVRGVNAFGAGPPTPDYVLRVGADGLVSLEAPTSIVAFMNGGRLTLTWAAPTAGGPPSGYLVEAGSATGAANIATLPVNGRSFTFSPVPDGFYFLRVRARTATQVGPPSAEAMIVVGNVDSPPGPPSFNSPTVSGSTVTLNWTTPAVGGATRYVIEAGSAPGRSDLAVVDTGGPSLTRVVTNVPSGIYYVRVRAVNALGAGVVSNERMIRVGS